jgi:hypothetical protein
VRRSRQPQMAKEHLTVTFFRHFERCPFSDHSELWVWTYITFFRLRWDSLD